MDNYITFPQLISSLTRCFFSFAIILRLSNVYHAPWCFMKICCCFYLPGKLFTIFITYNLFNREKFHPLKLHRKFKFFALLLKINIHHENIQQRVLSHQEIYAQQEKSIFRMSKCHFCPIFYAK